MYVTKWIMFLGLIALSVAAATPPVLAAEPHGHATVGELKLNQGKKWPTDEALRRGMSGIRTAVADSLDAIHRNKFSASEYSALADRLQVQVDYVVANCKLPEEADRQLHVLLEQILDSISAMKTGSQPQPSAVKLVTALDLYGAHFEHAGWRPVAH